MIANEQIDTPFLVLPLARMVQADLHHLAIGFAFVTIFVVLYYAEDQGAVPSKLPLRQNPVDTAEMCKAKESRDECHAAHDLCTWCVSYAIPSGCYSYGSLSKPLENPYLNLASSLQL